MPTLFTGKTIGSSKFMVWSSEASRLVPIAKHCSSSLSGSVRGGEYICQESMIDLVTLHTERTYIDLAMNVCTHHPALILELSAMLQSFLGMTSDLLTCQVCQLKELYLKGGVDRELGTVNSLQGSTRNN